MFNIPIFLTATTKIPAIQIRLRKIFFISLCFSPSPIPRVTSAPLSEIAYPKPPICRYRIDCQCSKPAPIRHFPIATGRYLWPQKKDRQFNIHKTYS